MVKEDEEMGGYILCQLKRAKMPYYIENISTNIYSMEELCYYFYHNIYLLDDTIINEHLCDWLKTELNLVPLYRKLYRILEEERGTSEFILTVFKEIHYLSHSEFKKLHETLELLEKQPPVMREKKKGDYLVENKMYVNALRIYEKALSKKDRAGMGEQFTGEILHNMGCAYMHMFQFKEASECFLEGYQYLHHKKVLTHHLLAGYLASPEDFPVLCQKAGVDKEQQKEMLDELKKALEGQEEPGDAEALLEGFIRDYHRSAGF